VLIVGLAMGGAMDLIPPLGVYAAMLREQGRPLDFPGGAARVAQAVDVDLLARAIAWSGEAESARNEAFNVTNGDVFTWENIWPAISDNTSRPRAGRSNCRRVWSAQRTMRIPGCAPEGTRKRATQEQRYQELTALT